MESRCSASQLTDFLKLCIHHFQKRYLRKLFRNSYQFFAYLHFTYKINQVISLKKNRQIFFTVQPLSRVKIQFLYQLHISFKIFKLVKKSFKMRNEELSTSTQLKPMPPSSRDKTESQREKYEKIFRRIGRFKKYTHDLCSLISNHSVKTAG